MNTELTDEEVFDLYPEVMIDRDNIQHYRALARGKLMIQQCQDCHYWVYPHRPACPQCWSWTLAFREVSGRGKLFFHTLIYQTRDPAERVTEPVAVAAVELEEQPGLRYLSRIVDCPPEQLVLDMPLTLVWRSVNGLPTPAFAPLSVDAE